MIFNLDTRRYVARNPRWAIGAWERLRGMMMRRFDDSFDAMVFDRCGAIHTCGMSIAIDVLFLDRNFRVVRAEQCCKPWRPAVCARGAVTVIELPPGAIAASRTGVGDTLNLNTTLSYEAIEKAQNAAILNAKVLPFDGECRE